MTSSFWSSLNPFLNVQALTQTKSIKERGGEFSSYQSLYDTVQVEDFGGCSRMDSRRRSSGTVPPRPHTFSSPKIPVSIISSCQGMEIFPEANSSKKSLSESSRLTPFTVENAPTSSRFLAYTVFESGTNGGGRIPKRTKETT